VKGAKTPIPHSATPIRCPVAFRAGPVAQVSQGRDRGAVVPGCSRSAGGTKNPTPRPVSLGSSSATCSILFSLSRRGLSRHHRPLASGRHRGARRDRVAIRSCVRSADL
jgi:hypothetical protein